MGSISTLTSTLVGKSLSSLRFIFPLEILFDTAKQPPAVKPRATPAHPLTDTLESKSNAPRMTTTTLFVAPTKESVLPVEAFNTQNTLAPIPAASRHEARNRTRNRKSVNANSMWNSSNSNKAATGVMNTTARMFECSVFNAGVYVSSRQYRNDTT